MDERAYWLWAQQAFPPGNRKPMKLAGQYGGELREFHDGGPKLWNSRPDLTDREAAALRDFTLAQAEARLEYAEKMGWAVLAPCDPGYPTLLREIPDPPSALFLKGALPPVDEELAIAVVGSRKAGPAIEDLARGFGCQLAAGGAHVVSGGAVGVDSAALTGAMAIPGSQPVSVLPVSLDSGYLARNAKLRRMVAEHGGALVSEYFSQDVPVPGTFPLRNRLITGLARGVLLIQAARKSGTMIYARHALDQNRDVFVYPGPAGDPLFAGGLDLLADGAKAAASGEELLASYGGPAQGALAPALFQGTFPLPAEEPVPALADPAAGLEPPARLVLEALGPSPATVQDLAQRTGLPPSQLLGLLTELELEGLAESLPGKRYISRRP